MNGSLCLRTAPAHSLTNETAVGRGRTDSHQKWDDSSDHTAEPQAQNDSKSHSFSFQLPIDVYCSISILYRFFLKIFTEYLWYYSMVQGTGNSATSKAKYLPSWWDAAGSASGGCGERGTEASVSRKYEGPRCCREPWAEGNAGLLDSEQGCLQNTHEARELTATSRVKNILGAKVGSSLAAVLENSRVDGG